MPRTKTRFEKKRAWTRNGRSDIRAKHTIFMYADEDNDLNQYAEPVMTSRTVVRRLGPRISMRKIQQPLSKRPTEHSSQNRTLTPTHNRLKKWQIRREAELEQKYWHASGVSPAKSENPQLIQDQKALLFEQLSTHHEHCQRTTFDGAVPHSISSVEKLPSEVLLMIKSYLSPQYQVWFSTASHTLLCKMGHPDVPSLTGKKYKNLMHLWDDDSLVLTYCPWCKTMHSPFESTQVPKIEHHEQHVSAGCLPCQKLRYADQTYLHPRLHYIMMHAIMKWHRKGLDCVPFLRQLQKNAPMAFGCHDTHLHIQRSERSRIVKDRLLSHEQIMVTLQSGSWKDKRATSALFKSIASLSLGQSICQHCEWLAELDREHREGILHCLLVPVATTVSSFVTAMDGTSDYEAPNDQTTFESRIARKGARRPPNRPAGTLGSRTYCYTDFAFNSAVIKGFHNRVLVLSTWKDFGSGLSMTDKRWRSFLPPSPQLPLAKIRETHCPNIFRDFEEVDDPFWRYGGSNHIYRPRITPHDLDRLRRESS
ncbi:hypothetical protein F5Y15DRAFT_125469 [Xylariaceae sp. FL0016]|nr:hypothetical protein F5Y15DRAFT_125469 [Xylariaceae sp. FL0016]